MTTLILIHSLTRKLAGECLVKRITRRPRVWGWPQRGVHAMSQRHAESKGKDTERRRGRRPFSGSYEGDGKTTVTVLNQEEQDLLMLDTYSSQGFRLASGIFLVGPVAVFPRSVFQWDVRTALDINEASLSMFWLLEPKIDVLIIGVGDRGVQIPQETRLMLLKRHICAEVLPTAQAVPTFNFLNADNRNVAAALIPPLSVDFDRDHDSFQMLNTRKKLFKDTGRIAKAYEQELEDNRIMSERERKVIEKGDPINPPKYK